MSQSFNGSSKLKDGMQSFKNFLLRSTTPKSGDFGVRHGNGPSSGLYHYSRVDGDEKSRVHLRIDPDGNGTLIVNASSVMHLNPTAAFMAWLVLEGKTKEERTKFVTSRYAISKRQAESDLSSFLFHPSSF